MSKKKTVAQLRSMICTAGYYRKRMNKMLRRERFWARYVSSPTKFSEEALENMLRYQRKAEWYRKRQSWEPIMVREQSFEIALTEEKFRMLAKDLRDLMGCEHCEHDTKGASLALAARLVYRVFACSVPDGWTKEE